MSHFLKPTANRIGGATVRISSTTQTAYLGTKTMFGLWGSRPDLLVGPTEETAAEIEFVAVQDDVYWFYLTPQRSGEVTIEARFTVDNRVWDDFKLSMQEPVKAPAKSGVAAWKTPEEFLRDYKNISVTTAAGGTSTVSLNTYRCAREDDGGLGDALPFLQAVRSAANQAKMKREWDVLMTKASTLVFWGKGAPGDIGKVLSAIDGVASNAAALPGFGTFRPSVDRPNRLQFICDTYLGVDCNGFVGNYARLLGVPDADPELPPPGWLTIGTKNLRESPEEIARGDVVIWAGGVHIALVERAAVEGRGSVLDVVQSTAGGPQLTRRHIALPSKLGAKRFEIRAGSTHCAMLPRDNLIVKSIGLV